MIFFFIRTLPSKLCSLIQIQDFTLKLIILFNKKNVKKTKIIVSRSFFGGGGAEYVYQIAVSRYNFEKFAVKVAKTVFHFNC